MCGMRGAAFALFGLLTACFPTNTNTWAGQWVNDTPPDGAQSAALMLDCPGQSAEPIPTAVTLTLNDCAEPIAFQLTFGEASCSGLWPFDPTAASSVPSVTFSGTCTNGWTLSSGSVVLSTDPYVQAMQLHLSGTGLEFGETCAFSIDGPLYQSPPLLCDGGLPPETP